MKKIIVLGAGMVGSAIAIDLSAKFQLTLTDLNENRLNVVKAKCPAINVRQLDVRDAEKLRSVIQLFDLVVCAVPGFLGFETVKSIIQAGKDLVDISFFPENALDLNDLAIKNNVTAIVDCGVAPGMGNLILGRYNEILKLNYFECIVGGLPKVRTWPFEYKAPFSPVDVIEEYTRPARYIENGKLIIRDALSDCELVEFETIGTLESFNSDGLRTLIHTMPHIENMKEKTLRYPGHVEYIRVLKESGFFSKNPLIINGTEISPLEFTSRILFKDWKLGEDEEEITVMRIILKGVDNDGTNVKIIYNLHDSYCRETGTSSMARTTGYTATAAVNMLINNLFPEKGIFPPELIGKDEKCFGYIIEYLKKRNIHYIKSEFPEN